MLSIFKSYRSHLLFWKKYFSIKISVVLQLQLVLNRKPHCHCLTSKLCYHKVKCAQLWQWNSINFILFCFAQVLRTCLPIIAQTFFDLLILWWKDHVPLFYWRTLHSFIMMRNADGYFLWCRWERWSSEENVYQVDQCSAVNARRSANHRPVWRPPWRRAPASAARNPDGNSTR